MSNHAPKNPSHPILFAGFLSSGSWADEGYDRKLVLWGSR